MNIVSNSSQNIYIYIYCFQLKIKLNSFKQIQCFQLKIKLNCLNKYSGRLVAIKILSPQNDIKICGNKTNFPANVNINNINKCVSQKKKNNINKCCFYNIKYIS